ncbi:MAG TPA: PilC/PilY family type IV pilus protein [Burkholderiaceae bacterium]|nr:PilC/PilY family type IV pilus protein [Burkholderiaceae bacterium]
MRYLPHLRHALCVAGVGMASALPALGEDIDLYTGNGSGAPPNVLFFLDNSSNWSANNQAWKYTDVYNKCASKYSGNTTKIQTCQGYVNQVFRNGADSSLVQGQVEVRALKLVLNSLYCTATSKVNFNAGIMLFNTAGSPDSSSVVSGYIRHAVKPMSTQQCQSPAPTGADLTQYLVADLDNIDAKIQNNDFKGPSSTEYGAPLYEAFKYFGGWTSPDKAPGSVTGGSAGVAGTPTGAIGFGPVRYGLTNSLEDPTAFQDSNHTTYASPITGGCGNNYIVLIGNKLPNQEYGTDQNATPATNTLMTRLGYRPSQLYATKKSDILFADEWAQFLYNTDVSSVSGKQNIRLFTINVYNGSPNDDQTTLLKSMANAGQGTSDNSGYFEVGGDLYVLITSLKNIVAQIAAVNSVFTSASLPVSVNAQGTFLNQVFMGVFRPDEKARQRWAGNLKQYQFSVSSNRTLYLSDANGQPAVDASKTGFLQNCATSFWTTGSGNYWEKITGSLSDCPTTTSQQSLYSDSPDGPIVERGGVGERLRQLGAGGYATRNIRTCTTTACSSVVDFTSSNITIPTPPAGFSSGTTSATLINWVRGQNLGDGNPDNSGVISYNLYDQANTDNIALGSTSMRPTVHGEVVHSTPLAVNYGTSATADVVVFYGSGDGMLHAVSGNKDSNGGSELWAFIAPEHWSGYDPVSRVNHLDRVHSNYPLIKYPNVFADTARPKTYFFDGSISGYQEGSGSALTRLWIFPTMRRGGNMVYAFDVTNKPSTTRQPQLLWRFGCATAGSGCATGATGESNMGQSWSAPVGFRVAGNADPYVIFGAGYDSCEDAELPTTCTSSSPGRGVFVMNAQRGASVAADYRYFAMDSTAGRFVADMSLVDINGDGYIDVIYAVDTRGNIWRINTSNPSNSFQGYTNGVADWQWQKIASLGNFSITAESRKLMYAPSVVVMGTQTMVLVGSGDREKPSSSSSATQVKNRFYGIRDYVTKTGTDVAVVDGTSTATGLLNVTALQSVSLSSVAAKSGWFMDLYSSQPYEQVVTTPLTIGGVVYFNTYQAKNSSSDNSACGMGTARGYQVDFQTGLEKVNSSNQYAPEEFLSQGIPPSPVGGLVTIDGQTFPFCLGCAGPTVLTPKTNVITVRPNRKPVYRYQRIDN